ncbi:MAG: peptidylprolyl isomerase, partial [Parvularculaceae bacterium]
MTAAKKGDEVVVAYTVRTDDGRVVGGTERDGPQTLKLGEGKIFPQIEDGLAGMAAGEEKAVTVPADDAFGPRRENLVLQIPRDQLPDDDAPQPGMQLSANAQDGQTLTLTITDVGEDAVTADGNHPLAGEDLHFALTLVEIKDAA